MCPKNKHSGFAWNELQAEKLRNHHQAEKLKNQHQVEKLRNQNPTIEKFQHKIVLLKIMSSMFIRAFK